MSSSLFASGFVVGLLAIPGASFLLITQHLRPWETARRNQLVRFGSWSGLGAIAFATTGSALSFGIAALGLVLSCCSQRWLRNYYVATQILLPALAIALLCGIGWGVTFLQSLSISLLTYRLMMSGLMISILVTLVGLIALLPSQSYLLRKRWYRPRHSLNPTPRTCYPKVSFHIPCYSEPPAVVCATLDALSQMRYPNFEVLLVDNNTSDPNLWLPLKYHCHRLNQSDRHPTAQPFRFFHVEQLAGAKAGALNFALEQTAPDAELIAIVDADYQAQPDFLERLVGFFDDPKLGFVQTPHDYRDWENNWYQRACYWEYALFFRLQLACLSEWVASCVIGTMCILRRSAIEAAGGWAEWCLTEDSESAVRIHALGYTSIFLNETFGRGLIPETFRGYKKQRFRWTVGPVQQLWKHWRLYLPDPWATPSRLSYWQRILELFHSSGGIQATLFLGSLLLGLASLASILYHDEVIPIPSVMWIAILAILPTALSQIWLSYYLIGCRSIPDMLAAKLAALSLGHIQFMGQLTAVLAARSPKWVRTNKFKVLPNQRVALQSVQTELILALLLIAIACSLMPQAQFSPPDFVFAAMMASLGGAIAYLAAPLMALLAEQQLTQSTFWGGTKTGGKRLERKHSARASGACEDRDPEAGQSKPSSRVRLTTGTRLRSRTGSE